MACRCAPALIALRNELNIRYPNRDKASDGCCGDSAHAARVSDHNPDASGYAHAHDFDEDLTPDVHSVGFLVPLLLADPRTKYVIYEKLIYKAGNPVGRPYSGANPHDKHLHLSIVDSATHDTRPWLGALDKPEPVPEPTPTTEDRMVLHVLAPGDDVSIPLMAPSKVAFTTDPFGTSAEGVAARIVVGPQWRAPVPGTEEPGLGVVSWIPAGARPAFVTVETDLILVVQHLGREQVPLSVCVDRS